MSSGISCFFVRYFYWQHHLLALTWLYLCRTWYPIHWLVSLIAKVSCVGICNCLFLAVAIKSFIGFTWIFKKNCNGKFCVPEWSQRINDRWPARSCVLMNWKRANRNGAAFDDGKWLESDGEYFHDFSPLLLFVSPIWNNCLFSFPPSNATSFVVRLYFVLWELSLSCHIHFHHFFHHTFKTRKLSLSSSIFIAFFI